MKSNQFFIIISLFLVLILSIGTLSASDDSNYTSLSESGNDLKKDNVIVVEPDENPNQIVKPTIQPAIDAANSGDTLILNGNFAHCHFLINKTLNIFADPETSLNSCPHYQTEDAGSYGVFYVTIIKRNLIKKKKKARNFKRTLYVIYFIWS